MTEAELAQLALDIKQQAKALGFQQAGITDTDLDRYEQRLEAWLAEGCHGSMDWMARHGRKRSRPEELEPGTCRVISLRMDYLPPDASPAKRLLKQADKAYISRYALGRDYHKLMRKRLQSLSDFIQQRVEQWHYRVFVDSAPVLEKPLAEKAGLGWMGKNTLIIHPQAGSWFFLGEIYTDLPLPVDQQPQQDQCGRCDACMRICPTDAIVAPYKLDARRCISYLTIEHKGAIPEEFRSAMGNRIYGCDDCQLICPWNRFATDSEEQDFRARHGLDEPELLKLFAMNETEFLSVMEGSAIRRIGYEQWQRNIAVAIGNAPFGSDYVNALTMRLRENCSELLREHIEWALQQQLQKADKS